MVSTAHDIASPWIRFLFDLNLCGIVLEIIVATRTWSGWKIEHVGAAASVGVRDLCTTRVIVAYFHLYLVIHKEIQHFVSFHIQILEKWIFWLNLRFFEDLEERTSPVLLLLHNSFLMQHRISLHLNQTLPIAVIWHERKALRLLETRWKENTIMCTA